MKHAARPKAPGLAAILLLGLALAGAVAPYLGIWLKQLDPAVPFVVTSLTLFAVTLGLSWVQRIVAALPAEARAPQDVKPAGRGLLAPLFLGTLFIAFGFQVHYFLNTKAQYLRFIEPANLISLSR